MIAYNKTWLANLEVHQQAEEAYYYQCISKEEEDSIKFHYPIGFYTPNSFVRIGLFILTVVIVLFSFGLLALLFLDHSGEKGFGILMIFFSLFAYVALELLIKEKQHYRSGADDALLWLTATFAVGGMNLLADISSLGNAVLLFIVSTYLVLRFKDALMSVVAVLSLAGILFYTYIELGSFAKATMSFLLIGFFALVYRFARSRVYPLYSNCLMAIEISGLIGIYLAGNYFLVREGGNSLLNLGLAEGEGILLGWFFWLLTVAIPLVYISRGIQKKDVVLLRIGLLLVALTVVTVCYYYQMLSLEAIMCLCGVLLIGVAYAFIRYLKQPRKGFTYQEMGMPTLFDKVQAEALVVTQTFGQQVPETAHTKFGGGSGGGGGATGNF